MHWHYIMAGKKMLWLAIKYEALRWIVQKERAFCVVFDLIFCLPDFFLCKIHDNEENNDGEYHTNYITSSHTVNRVTFCLCSILLQFFAVAILQTTNKSLPGLTRSSDNSKTLEGSDHWQIQGGARDMPHPPLPIQFLSFSCSFSQKSSQLIGFWP